MKRRTLSFILALIMVFCMIPTTVMADENSLAVSEKTDGGVRKYEVTYTVPNTFTANAIELTIGFDNTKVELESINWNETFGLGDGTYKDDIQGVNDDGEFTCSWSSARNKTVTGPTCLVTAIFGLKEGADGEAVFSTKYIVITDVNTDSQVAAAGATKNDVTVTLTEPAPTTYTVTINPGANMTFKSGEVNQTSVTIGNFMLDTYFTADVGYYFPDDYTVAEQNGVKVVRVSETEIKVTGKPTNNVNITLTDATEKPAATTYTVKVNGGTGVSRKTDPANGNSQQTVDQNTAIVPVVFEAWDDYYFPEGYGVNSGKLGINVTRNSPSKITVSGTPTADVTIGLPAATEKATQEPPTVGHTDCTAAGNDGTITGLTAYMQWKMGDSGDNWNNVSSDETELTGRAPGTYYVRYKATDTKKASEPATVVIKGYDPTVEMFTITFNPNGGKGDTKVVTVRKGDNYVIQNEAAYGIAAQDGMRFVYWSNNENNGQGSEHYPAGYEYRNVQRNLTFYAVWETTARTVQFDANGGTGTMNAVTATYGEEYHLPECTFTAPDGKEFDCWKIKDDNTNTSYNPGATYTIKSNVTFVAQWKVKQGGGEQQGYTLTFKPGEGNGRDHVVNGIDAQYNLPNPGDIGIAPPNDKPNFAGWKAEDGTVYPAGTDVPVTADATFVAQWKADGPQGDKVIVNFKPGDGKGDAFEVSVTAGDSYRLPAKPAGFKAPAGKVFAGWKIEDPQGNLNEKLYKAGHKFDLTEDVTFVAQWKTRPYYGDDTTTPDADPMVNPGTGAAPVGAPIAVVIAVAVAGAAYFVTTKKR